jgi:ketosteroid isomerase-like protein
MEVSMDPQETVDKFGEAWSAHDLDATLQWVTDDVVFESTQPAPDGAVFRGRGEVRAAWSPIFEDAAATFSVEESFAAGDRVVQRWRYEWADGHIRGVDLFTVRDGLVAEKRSYVKG